MCLATLIHLDSFEFLVGVLIILTLVGTRRLGKLVAGLRQGFHEFRKASQQVAEEWTGRNFDQLDFRPRHPVLTTLTVLLGAACLALVLYEFFRWGRQHADFL